MPKFLTIGYGDEAGYAQTPEALRAAAHDADAALLAQGAVIGRANGPVQVTNTERTGVKVSEGAYMTSTLPVAGFAVIEAPDLEAAIEMISKSPCAVCHGVIEVWPLTIDDPHL